GPHRRLRLDLLAPGGFSKRRRDMQTIDSMLARMMATLSEQNADPASAPMELSEKNADPASAPVELSEKDADSVSAPVEPSERSAVPVFAPTEPPERNTDLFKALAEVPEVIAERFPIPAERPVTLGLSQRESNGAFEQAYQSLPPKLLSLRPL